MIEKSTLYHRAGSLWLSLLSLCLTLATLSTVAQQTWVFTNAGAAGREGPTQAQVNTAYAGTLLEGNVLVENQGFQEWTVPYNAKYLIEVKGAQGGNSALITGGKGASVSGEFILSAGNVLTILVGQQGTGGADGATGGGGGTFVTLGNSHLTSSPLIIAGGGSGTGGLYAGNPGLTGTMSGAGDQCLAGVDNGQGGNSAATCGGGSGGAGGFLTDGAGGQGWASQRGYAFRNGALGGTSGSGGRVGGFGGAAGTHSSNTGGGAGGGYSGGSAPYHDSDANGGGGSSYNAGEEQINIAGVNEGHGSVTIVRLYSINLIDLQNATCHESADGSIMAEISGGIAPYTFEWSNGITTTSGTAITGFSLLGHLDEHSYYRSNNQFPTMEAAQTAALNNNGYLVSINSADENAWLMAHGVQHGDNLGGTDQTQEGTFSWISGEAMNYTNWSPGEPNNAGGDQDFMQIYADGRWDDVAWNNDENVRQIIELPGHSKISNLAQGQYTLTVTDSEGMVATRTFTVGPDPLSLDFSMTQSTTCSIDGNGQLQAIPSGGTAPYSYSWSSGESGSTIFDKAAGDYSVVVTDANNCNPISGSADITVSDDTDPIALTKDADVYVDDEGNATVTVEDINDGSYDDCAVADIYVMNGDLSCTGNVQIDGLQSTLVVVDMAGNVSSAQANINLIDTVKPIVLAKDIEVALGYTGTAIISAGMVNNGSTDNCGIESMSLNKNSLTCADLGSNEVILSVTDVSGNLRAAVAQVTVVDHIAPSLQVENFSVSLDAEGHASISADEIQMVTGDNCGVTSKSLSITEFTCEDTGEPVQLTVTATDAAGNETDVNVFVTVIDEVEPVAQATDYQIALNETGTAQLSPAMVAQFIGQQSYDNCSLAADGHTLSKMTFSCEDLGVNQVTYMVEDAAGNIGEAPVNITVIDNTVPSAMAQNLVVTLDENGQGSINAEAADNGSFDNCGIASKSLSISTFNCEDIGEREVILTVADASGNEAETTFTVTVVDNIAPVVPESVNMTLYLDSQGQAVFNTAPILAQISDNCGIDAIISEVDDMDLNGLPLSCDQVGQETGTLFARDINGNIAPFTINLTVLDTIKPSFNLNSIEISLNEEGMASLTQNMLLPYAEDNCGIAEVAIQNTSFDCSLFGEAQSTQILVYDLHGNYRQQTLEVILIDDIAPIVQVQEPVLELDANGSATLSTEALEMMVTDNCTIASYELNKTAFDCSDLGVNPVSLTVTDVAGNTGIASFGVEVVDNTAPQINAPLFILLCEGTAVNYENVTASDNCGAEVNLIDGPEAGSTPETGEHLAEFEAIDASGNTATHVMMVVVNPMPELDLGEDMEVLFGQTVTLTAGENNGSNYLWSTGETTPNISFVADTDRIISVSVTSADGCTVEDEIAITVLNPVGIAEAENGNTIRFFPNPTSGNLSLDLSLNRTAEKVKISITDLSGKLVAQKQLATVKNGERIELDLAALAKGVYLVNVQADIFNFTERVVKQ